VGRTISKKVRKETWGKGVVKELAVYILENAPEHLRLAKVRFIERLPN